MALNAGAAEIDITPPLGTQLAGDIGRYRPVEEVRDPLYVRALVVENGGSKIVLIQFDLCIVTTEWTGKIRDAVALELNVDRRAVMVCATQNHAAPGLGDFFVSGESAYIPDKWWWLRGSDPAYNPVVVERSVAAAIRANDALQPVEIGAAGGIESRVAFNRRFVMRDGSARAHPVMTCDPEIRYNEGPIDPEVGVVCFRNAAGEVIAALLHHTCHPCHGYPHRYVAADWPGAWAQGMKQLAGASCVPIVINGCCGNVHHRNHMDRDHVSDSARMGKLLTETTTEVLSRLEYDEDGTVAFRSTHLPLPWRPLSPEKMRSVRGLLAANPEPMWTDEAQTQVHWDWVYAVSLVDLEDMIARDSSFPYEVQAFRIGPVGLVGLGGEPFVEGQLRLKLASPAYPTYVAHMSNDYGGYIPTPQALARGGYETEPAPWSKFAPEALDSIIDTGIAQLRDLFA